MGQQRAMTGLKEFTSSTFLKGVYLYFEEFKIINPNIPIDIINLSLRQILKAK